MIRRALRKLGRAPEWLHGRLPNRGAILTYHRVGSADSADPFQIRITEEHFGEHLQVLRRQARPMSLEGMHAAVTAGSLPSGAVAVTLDDGYVDTLSVAKPLLARHEVPATAFIVTRQIGNARGFWWDELYRVVIGAPRLPENLELDIRGKRHGWRLASHVGMATRIGNHVRSRRTVTRAELLWQLHALLLPLAQDEWLGVLDRLLAWSGMRSECPAADRPLDARELLALADGGLVEIGAHSATHAQLPRLPASAQLAEMRESRAALQGITGRSTESFAYPHGSFDGHSVAAARAAGFSRACTTIPNRVTPVADPLRLPRIDVPDCDGEAFARALRWLLQ